MTTIEPTNPNFDVVPLLGVTPGLSGLRGKRLLLTGGTGFAGSWLLTLIAAFNDHLPAADRCQVYIPTRDPAAFARKAPQLAAHPAFTFVSGDVRSFPLPPFPCELIIHAAAPADPISLSVNPAAVADIIVAGSQRIIDFALRGGVERLLFVSSGAVYGSPNGETMYLTEAFSGGPALDYGRSAYAEAKRYVEVLLAVAREYHKLPVVIARPFTFVGPFQDLNSGFAVTDFIRDGLRGEALIVRNEFAMRSYAYGADLAAWLLAMLLQGKIGRVYNVGSAEPVSVLTLAQHVAKQLAAFDIAIDVRLDPPPPAANGQARTAQYYIPDVRRAQTELGLSLHYSLDEALSRTIAWFQAQLAQAGG